jgi:hypothetical protein
MFLATAIVLTSVTAATAAPSPSANAITSTYDQAACADEATGEDALPIINREVAAPDFGAGDCSEPPPAAVPAVLDCNDERMSRFVGEMIGSCDMPKASPLGAPQAVRAPAEGRPLSGARLCDGVHCSHDSVPIRAAARAPDEGRPLAASRFALSLHFLSTPLWARAELPLRSIAGPRLERPPRAV